MSFEVEQVFSWVLRSCGNREAAQSFRDQEVDGQALLLLDETHLHRMMALKLGPAVKIKSALQNLKASVQIGFD